MSGLTPEQAGYAERGLALVKELARVFARQWRAITEEELVSVGYEAIVVAARSFNPRAGVRFEAYARPGVWGALVDHATREHYVVARVSRELARAATAHPWELPEPDLNEWLDEPRPGVDERPDVVANVRARAAEILGSTFATHVGLPSGEDDLHEEITRQQLTTRLREALTALDDEERAFIDLYYEQEKTMDQIAKALGKPKRTLFRVHDRIKERLAQAMRRGGTG